MESKLKLYRKRGYLLVLAAILLVVVGVISTMLVSMFVGNSRSASDVSQSNAAFSVAQSALEIAKRDINSLGVVCDNYTRSGTVLNGVYTVTGKHTVYSDSLTSGIASTATTIPVGNASNFASPSGIVSIANEMISYTGVSGNNLTGALRGAFGTTVGPYYNAGTSVTQNICVLAATGGVPNLTNPDGKRVLQETMNGRVLFGGNVDAMVYSYGNTIVNGNNISITNSAANRTGSNPNYIYSGHTIASHGTATLNGNNDATFVNAPPNGLTKSSWSNNNINGDILQNYGGSSLTLGGYFDLFFNQSVYPNYSALVNAATQIQNSDVQITNGSPSDVSFSGGNLSINGNGTAGAPLTVTLAASGNMLQVWNGSISANGNYVSVVLGGNTAPKVVVVTGNVTLNGNNVTMQIGTSTMPVALITGGYYLENGNNIQTGLDGFIYAKGTITFNGNNPILSKQGIIVSEGNTIFNGNNIQVNLDPTTIAIFGSFGNMFNTYYSSLDLQEVFK